VLKETITNADGRTDAPLLAAAAAHGHLRDPFHIGAYFTAHPVAASGRRSSTWCRSRLASPDPRATTRALLASPGLLHLPGQLRHGTIRSRPRNYVEIIRSVPVAAVAKDATSLLPLGEGPEGRMRGPSAMGSDPPGSVHQPGEGAFQGLPGSPPSPVRPNDLQAAPLAYFWKDPKSFPSPLPSEGDGGDGMLRASKRNWRGRKSFGPNWWRGDFRGQTLESTLARLMHGAGGLTHGRKAPHPPLRGTFSPRERDVASLATAATGTDPYYLPRSFLSRSMVPCLSCPVVE